MTRQSRVFPVRPQVLPSASRARAKPRLRHATDDADEGAYLEEWMIGYPSAVVRTTG